MRGLGKDTIVPSSIHPSSYAGSSAPRFLSAHSRTPRFSHCRCRHPESLRKVPESHLAKRSLMSESLFFLFQSFFRLFFSYLLFPVTPSCVPRQLHNYSYIITAIHTIYNYRKKGRIFQYPPQIYSVLNFAQYLKYILDIHHSYTRYFSSNSDTGTGFEK